MAGGAWNDHEDRCVHYCSQILEDPLKKALLFEIGLVFEDVEAKFVVVDDSRHAARMYTLLVAHTSTGLRFGRDWLYDEKSKNKSLDKLSTEIAQKVVDELDVEVRKGGLVDEYLQDQLIVFQALAEGRSIIPGTPEAVTSDREHVDRTDEPFGDGSTHTTTARWVASQLLPQVKWIDKGRVCEGAGWTAGIGDSTSLEEALRKVNIA
jgi:RNA 3'-terminal phosphate cyclase (ATP)